MANSMTGYGITHEVVGNYDIVVEMKSVNNRYLDLFLKGTKGYSFLEEKIKPFLQQNGITRGKIDINVIITNLEMTDTLMTIDEAYATSYIESLRRLRDLYQLSDDISVMKVAEDRNVFTLKQKEEDTEEIWNIILPVLQKTTIGFLSSRNVEGERLSKDILQKIDELEKHVQNVEKISQNDVETYREKLTQRIKDSLKDCDFVPDENKLLTEISMHADKIAIDEEIVRLKTHIISFRNIMKDKEPVGRKLDFLIQEMNREINTTGSKCSNAEIAMHVVESKCILEKIREQIQNLE